MGKLIYHSLQGDQAVAVASPFDAAALKVARSDHIRVVSPYIGVSYLERLIRVAGAWHLITDVREWLGSLSIRARPRAWEFIRENVENIRHCPDVHAKAIIGDTLAMMGSANFTNHGILGRTEMGILIDDPDMVAEIGAWFEELWSRTTTPLVDETSAYVQWLDDEAKRPPIHRQRFAISGPGRLVRARLTELDNALESTRECKDNLDLGDVARTLVVQEQKHYDSLNHAVEEAVDKLASMESFTLADVVSQVSAGFEGAIIRDVYYLLLQHCANHVRSVFSETTRNRLILNGGRFTQSMLEPLKRALAPYDRFLAYLIGHLDFHTARELPFEDVMETDTGIPCHHHALLVAELTECGLLDMEDIAGDLPKYSLVDDFPWDGRYGMFHLSHRKWLESKTVAPSPIPRTGPTTSDGYDGHRVKVGAMIDDADNWDGVLPPSIERMASGSMEMLHGPDFELIRAGRNPDLKTMVDSILANILTGIVEGRPPMAADMRELAARLYHRGGTARKLGRVRMEEVLVNAEGRWPHVFVLSGNGGMGRRPLKINPNLSWESLDGFPATRRVCLSFLGVKG